jgi:hypothetical protein
VYVAHATTCGAGPECAGLSAPGRQRAPLQALGSMGTAAAHQAVGDELHSAVARLPHLLAPKRHICRLEIGSCCRCSTAAAPRGLRPPRCGAIAHLSLLCAFAECAVLVLWASAELCAVVIAGGGGWGCVDGSAGCRSRQQCSPFRAGALGPPARGQAACLAPACAGASNDGTTGAYIMAA